ncbi:hypothetical protein [uncultured Methanobrevibacter sp.]|nr:hypothetical protein [uncultured Methanobrevibacter sp.]
MIILIFLVDDLKFELSPYLNNALYLPFLVNLMLKVAAPLELVLTV